jgi:hypothetical protein
MRVRTLLLTLTLLGMSLVTAPGVDSPVSKADCLAPLDPYVYGGVLRDYRDVLWKRFLREGVRTFVQMIVMPAFEPEYSVALHGGGPNDLDWSKADKYQLTYYTPDKNIWYSLPQNNNEHQQKDVSISVITVELPKETARRTCAVWQRMLQRTHYFVDESIRLDATSAEFSFGLLYGDTLVPTESSSVAHLLELGHCLIDYCKATPEKRSAAAKTIDARAATLERYLRAHPRK